MSQYKNGYRTACTKNCGPADREVWPLPPVPGKELLNSWNFLRESMSAIHGGPLGPHQTARGFGGGSGDGVQPHGQGVATATYEASAETGR